MRRLIDAHISEHSCPLSCKPSIILVSSLARYHVPRSWFQPSGNILVIFEEKGGDPTKITFSKRQVIGLCGFVSTDYPSMDLESWDQSIKSNNGDKAAMHLQCPEGMLISSITFASFGNPSGTCRYYRQGSCHYPDSISVVEKVL